MCVEFNNINSCQNLNITFTNGMRYEPAYAAEKSEILKENKKSMIQVDPKLVRLL